MRKVWLWNVLALVFLGCDGSPAGVPEQASGGDTHEMVAAVSAFGYEVLPNGCQVTEGVVQKGRVVMGTNGPDLIWCRGATQPVHVLGRGGNDVISGSSYDDLLFGGEGCDFISAHGGDDVLRGGLGDDDHSCRNGPYFEIYYLGGMCGGPGDDSLYGGPGTDRFNSPTSWCQYGYDTCSGGPGVDSEFYNCDECTDPNGDC